MEKIKRNERLAAMTRILMDTPNRIHVLSEFCELFGAAKSTISEDIDIISASVARFDLGRVETIAGAAEMLSRREGTPDELRDAVTSPKGTTFAGLEVMRQRDFRGMLRDVVIAARDRSVELGK